MSQTFDSEISHYQQILHLPKRDACGSSSSSSIQNYDLGLHIFAVFLILLCGTTACSFPVLVKAFPKLAISRHALFVSRHFGTGVLIALAFAHLLPTAFENLWDECLPYFWTEGYDAMPGVIAMISALVVMLVEMVFTMQGVRHSHVPPSLENAEDESDRSQSRNTDQSKVCDLPRQARDEDATWRMASSNQAPKASEPPFQEDSAADTRHTSKSASTIRSDAASQQKAISEQQEGRMMLQCLLLEAGILFHSVFIGLSISLSSGTTFIALMVAISFHQIFEGLALGGRIAAIPSLRISSIKPWAMSFAYGLTCPLGQAIGLGIRKTYDPEGMTALLVVGIANAISAGMIMYAGLVQLLGEDLLSEESYRQLSLRSRIEATTALVLGCGLMAMIAIWA